MNDKIRDYVRSNLFVFNEDVDFSDDDNFFQKGFVNSLFAMKLISYIEKEYEIKIEGEDLNLENFSSINNISSFISMKKGD